MIMRIVSILLIAASITHADISDRPIKIRLPPQNRKPNFMKEMAPPRPMPLEPATSFNRPQKLNPGIRPSLTPAAQLPVIPPAKQQFVPRPITTPPPPPPINIPPDVQNQLIKFFGLDSFGIPGLTGNHPDGFAGAIQELRAAGIPVQGTSGSGDAAVAYSTDAEAEAAAQTASRSGIRRQQNTAQRVLSGVAAALGGGGGRGPVHAGLPRIPGIPLLPSGIPRNEQGSEFGPVRYSIGYAFRGGNKDAMLQLHSSETPDAQPFWIYKLGPEGTDPFGNPQYEWAVVSNWVKYPVTVLVRDPDKFKAKYEQEVLRWLEDQGFINGFIRAFNMLQPASYSSCQYADSTFEVFGPSKRLT
ncbi:unnamed protein product [Onchocerca flexuosa]|uniref:Secreted protein n=1 Tax=Onchocerca flexuosa TaxID=387005 RepID=A0A183I1X4_9BILA|nr:unnamed protein product [Onchocerca flexuosa]